MIRFIKKIIALYKMSDRIMLIENEVLEIDERIKQCIVEHSKQFEKKIQQMTFAYTSNLDDTKSDYLKCYVEQRLNGMQHELLAIPKAIASLENKLTKVNLKIEDKRKDKDKVKK